MKQLCLLMPLLFLSLAGCSRTADNIQRIDSRSTHLTTVHWGAEELHEMAAEMTESFLHSRAVDFYQKPLLTFSRIKNSTYDQIDTVGLSDMIRTGLIKSKRVKITSLSAREARHHTLDDQELHKNSFRAIRKAGHEQGINGIFYGEISAIYRKNSLQKDMFFKFALHLADVESAENIWSHEIEIRKIRKKDLISW